MKIFAGSDYKLEPDDGKSRWYASSRSDPRFNLSGPCDDVADAPLMAAAAAVEKATRLGVQVPLDIQYDSMAR